MPKFRKSMDAVRATTPRQGLVNYLKINFKSSNVYSSNSKNS